MDRRAFIRSVAWGGAGLAAACVGCSATPGGAVAAPRVAFNTANLVARFTGYRFELKRWGDQHRATVEATDEQAWAAICQEISATGFPAVEIWEAHASPETMTEDRAKAWRQHLDENGLRPIAYAGHLAPETIRVCRWLGISLLAGSAPNLTTEEATKLCSDSGIRFCYENHPEKSVEEILAKIGGGNNWLGVCVDTGWLGTQGVAAPDAIRALGGLVRHTHIKDVKAAGAHETCLLGEGIVDVADAIAALRQINYAGWYSWEDEPEDRNPFDSAVRNRRWIEDRLA